MTLLLLFGSGEISATGTLVATASSIDAAVSAIVAADGDLQTATAGLQGDTEVTATFSGVLDASSADVSGAFTIPELRALVSWAEIELVADAESMSARGELIAAASSIDGIASADISVTGVLQAAAADITVSLEIPISAAGALLASSADITAAIDAALSVVGDLNAAPAGIDSAVGFGALIFIGDLQSQLASMAGEVTGTRVKIRTALGARRDMPTRNNEQSRYASRDNTQGRYVRRMG